MNLVKHFVRFNGIMESMSNTEHTVRYSVFSI
jgi:hypothetical protein